jgi:DNA-binding transcriptional regulator YiaG
MPIYAVRIRQERAGKPNRRATPLGRCLCRSHQSHEETQMSKLGDELIQSMAQARAHARGRKSRVRTRQVPIRAADIQKARKQLGLSQSQFADAFASARRR